MARAATAALAIGAFLATVLPLPCRADHPAQPQPLAPTLRIAVDPLGYKPPSSFYLTYKLSSASIGFFDPGHLLFTFRVGGLLQRIPNDPPDDEDHQIHVMVLDTATGKVLRETEWRLHDRDRYIWPIAGGRFLVRIRDSLFLLDQSLQLTPWLTFDTPVRHVEVSPDRQWVVVEAADPNQPHQNDTGVETPDLATPVRVQIMHPGASSIALSMQAQTPVAIPIAADSVIDVLEGGQISGWAIRAVPFSGNSHVLAEIKSSCQPSVQPVSNEVVLALGCFGEGDDRPVDAITLDGRDLWRQRWQTRFVWPWFAYAVDGSRFAYESVQVSRPISAFDALYSEDVTNQMVGVFDTATGKSVLVRDASPVLTAGQNVDLTADGRRVAILRQGAIEIYDLPPAEPLPPPPPPKKKK